MKFNECSMYICMIVVRIFLLHHFALEVAISYSCTPMHKDRSRSWLDSFQAQFDAETARDPFKRLAGVPERRWSKNALAGAVSNLGRRSTATRPTFSNRTHNKNMCLVHLFTQCRTSHH